VPYFISLFFVLIVVPMGYELSRDVIRAAPMAEELGENLGEHESRCHGRATGPVALGSLP